MDKELKPNKQIPVRPVGITGKSALVEWQGKRAYIPLDKLGDKVDLELLEAAPAYGVPWADMPIKPFTGEQLQAALNAADIWTESDLRLKTRVVIGVLEALLGVHLGSMVEFAAKHKLNEVK